MILSGTFTYVLLGIIIITFVAIISFIPYFSFTINLELYRKLYLPTLLILVSMVFLDFIHLGFIGLLGIDNEEFFEVLEMSVFAVILIGTIYIARELSLEFLHLKTVKELEEKVAKRTSELKKTNESLIKEISDHKKSEEKIEHMAYHDQLTGLPNRSLLIDRLNQILARGQRQKEIAAVLFMDLDRFKYINDSLGHASGDELLKEVAGRLERCIRKADTVARHGGDEFVILIQDLSKIEHIANIIEKVFAAFEAPFNLGMQKFFVTTSMGVSIYPNDGNDAEVLLKNADIAMYRAKEEGRNTYQFFTTTMQESANARLDLEFRLHKAIEKEEFLLHYQPQVDVTTGDLIGLEALLRWQDPEEGLIPPEKFIPLAEDTGLIVPIGDWVLRTACTQNKLWQDKGMKAVSIAVNISMRQFKQKDFVSLVKTILEETGLDPQYLELELTETILMDDVESVIKKLHALKTIGIKLSIDDFGTGYSSLEYLKRMPVDMLKIAQEFVKDINVDLNDAAIAKATIQMARSMGMDVMAEGVETIEHQKVLSKLRCNKTQGYLFSKPLSSEKVEKFLEINQPFKLNYMV